MRHLIAFPPFSISEKRNMFWLHKISAFFTQMNIAGNRGLQRISNQSGRRAMDEWSMYQISYLRWLVELSYPIIRSLISSSYQINSISLHSKPERLPTPKKASMCGGISPSWPIRSRSWLKSLSTCIPIALQSSYLIGPLHIKALQRMHSISITWTLTQEEDKGSYVIL